MTQQTPNGLPPALVWLADAPLFIDADHVGRFYDAVARPEARQGAINLEISNESLTAIKGKLNIEGTLTPEKFAALLAPVFAFVKPMIKGGVQGDVEKERKRSEASSFELLPIATPQRDLVILTIHYLVNHPQRLFFPNDESWYNKADIISAVPRALAFLDLPGVEEAGKLNRPATKLIPTAAEFVDDKIEQIYKNLGFTDNQIPPYPESAQTVDDLRVQRKAYWKWFDENYSATKAMVAVEEAASRHGKIRWIDYRLPMSISGDTLHLHLCPAGEYDSGVLAYNLITRGYKHGIRLVGTLKSEPDMNVLAVYDK